MTPAARIMAPDGRAALPGLIRALGVAGVELAPHPTDPARLRHRPAAIDPEHADGLRRFKPAVLALLRGEGVPSGGTDAAYVFEERLGVADGLALPAHPGSSAWLVAIGESLEVSYCQAANKRVG